MKIPYSVKVLVLFLVSYLLLFLLAAFNGQLQDWEGFITPQLNGDPASNKPFYDPLFLLAPIPGFFLIFFGIKWVNQSFDNLGENYFFPIGFVILSYVAFYTASVAFFLNNYLLYYQQVDPTNGFGKAVDQASAFVMANFTNLILNNAFFVFALAGVLGWISYKVISYWQEIESKSSSAPAAN